LAALGPVVVVVGCVVVRVVDEVGRDVVVVEGPDDLLLHPLITTPSRRHPESMKVVPATTLRPRRMVAPPLADPSPQLGAKGCALKEPKVPSHYGSVARTLHPNQVPKNAG